METMTDKWNKIYQQQSISEAIATEVLVDNAILLPKKGRALDLAAGLGANAVFLAKQGLAVDALDISNVAMNKLQQFAQREGLAINALQQNIRINSLKNNRYDVIVVSHFLDRSLCHAIMEGLNLGGLLFYQTFTCEKVSQKGPNNPEYLLAKQELLQLFVHLNIVLYRDNAAIGDINSGLRNEAQFIGQKIQSRQ